MIISLIALGLTIYVMTQSSHIKSEMKVMKKQLEALQQQLKDLGQKPTDIEEAESSIRKVESAPIKPIIQEPMAHREIIHESSEILVVQPQEIKATEDVKVVQPQNTQIEKKINAFTKGLFSVESIISKLGIILLLIGVGFIFKLAYDNGYITEEVAIFFGVICGVALGFIASRVLLKGRKVLSQVLFGGSIATLYITTYSAYAGYSLIPSVLGFIFMCAITIIAFIIAISIDSVAMSVFGMVGGLITPFIIRIEGMGFAGLGLYVTMIAIGSMVIYIFKRWRILQIASIVGTMMVTTYFISIEGLTLGETYRLAGLIVLLLIIFNGIEYGLHLINKASTLGTYISPLIVGILPLISLLQLNVILDFTDHQWSLVYAIVALVYLCMTAILYKKNGHTILSDVTLSFIALFVMLALVLYFGGDIRLILIIVLSLIFYYIAGKMSHNYTRIIGHIVYGIGFVSALATLIDDMFQDSSTWIEVVTRLIILGALCLGALMQKHIMRLILGIATFEIYGLLLLHYQINEWVQESYILAAMILAQGLYLLVLILIAKYLKVIPQLSVIIMGVLPFVLQLMISAVTVYDQDVQAPQIFAYIIYGALLYLIAHFYFKEEQLLYRLMFKVLGFTIIAFLLLVDASVGLEHFGYGVLFFGGLIFAIHYLEPDRNNKIIKTYELITRGLWLFFLLIHIAISFDRFTFNWLEFLCDAILLGSLYLMLTYFKNYIPLVYRMVINVLAFMIITTLNLKMTSFGNGIITLLWAAYGISLLTWSVIKAHKGLIKLALIVIICIAVKFVIIDLSTVSTLWKILVSMAFGTALLVLSYFLQPILSNETE